MDGAFEIDGDNDVKGDIVVEVGDGNEDCVANVEGFEDGRVENIGVVGEVEEICAKEGD